MCIVIAKDIIKETPYFLAGNKLKEELKQIELK